MYQFYARRDVWDGCQSVSSVRCMHNNYRILCDYFRSRISLLFFLQINDDDDGEIVDAIYFRLSLLRFVAC